MVSTWWKTLRETVVGRPAPVSEIQRYFSCRLKHTAPRQLAASDLCRARACAGFWQYTPWHWHMQDMCLDSAAYDQHEQAASRVQHWP
jgi:hypothetical protein